MRAARVTFTAAVELHRYLDGAVPASYQRTSGPFFEEPLLCSKRSSTTDGDYLTPLRMSGKSILLHIYI